MREQESGPGNDSCRASIRGGPRVVADRLTLGGNIIETGTDSFRLAQTRAKDRPDPTGNAGS